MKIYWHTLITQSLLSTSEFSWYCWFYEFRQMYKDMNPPRWCHTGYFHCPKNPLCSIMPSSLPNPNHHRPFLVSAFPSLDCHTVGVLQYVAFSDWLLLLVSCAMLLNLVQLFVTPFSAALQAPLSMGLYRQEYWSLPFPTLGESSWPKGRNCISCIFCTDTWIFYHRDTWEACSFS